MIPKIKLFITAVFIILFCDIYASNEKLITSLGGNHALNSGILVNKKLDIRDQDYSFIVNNPISSGTPYTDLFHIAGKNTQVVLRYDDRNMFYTTNTWSLNVIYDIDLYDETGTVVQSYTNQSLTIDYDPAEGTTYKDKDIINYEGYIRARLTVTTVDFEECTGPSSCTTTHALTSDYNDIYLDLIQNTEKNYWLYAAPYFSPEVLTANENTSRNQLEIAWQYMYGAESYDLEWVFIDEPTESLSGPLSYDFKNASRINTPFNHFEIPLGYPRGLILFRVRGVGVDPLDNDIVVESAWSVLSESGLANSISSTNGYYFLEYDGLDLDMNWQYTASFAEDGKRKEVISYFDGSMRSRQSTTVLNTDDNAIVAESKYDHEGRPSVSILPVPVPLATQGIRYYNNFNPSFDRTNFDTDSKINNPDPLSTSGAGAGYYYSSTNTNTDGFNAYTPDAEGYAYVQTRFATDGTGRVRSQSMPGVTHKLGSGHETRYFYASVTSQTEIDRLFGNEVGSKVHYRKEMIADANGQVSMSYYDQEGRVIATAIAGREESSPLLAIDGAPEDSVFTDDLLIGNNGLNQNGEMVSVTTLAVPTTGNYVFSYSLDKDSICDDCFDPSFCSDCKYELTISITDEFGEYVPLNITTAGCNTDVSGDKIFCDDLSATSSVEFDVDLSLGTFTITKTLKVDEESLLAFAQSFEEMTANGENDCVPLAVVEPEPCSFDCSTLCAEQFIDRAIDGTFIQWVDEDGVTAGTDEETVPTSIQDLINDCEEICDTQNGNPNIPTQCDILYNAMLADMSPNGQYFDNLTYGSATPTDDYFDANIASVSGFWTTFVSELASTSCTTAVDFSSAPNQNWSTLRDNWEDCFGPLLLKYHPEYCASVHFCDQIQCSESVVVDIAESNAFNHSMSLITDDATANSAYYFNPVTPFGATSTSNGVANDNSDYNPYNESSSVTDPLFDVPKICQFSLDCNSGTIYHDVLLYTRLQNFLDIGSSNYYSIWYVIDDPDDIAGGGTGVSSDVEDYFQMLHGDGVNPGIIGTGTGQITKYQFFYSNYAFLRDAILYSLFSAPKNLPSSCIGATLLTPEPDGFTTDGFIPRIPANPVYDAFYSTLNCDGSTDITSLSDIIEDLTTNQYEENCQSFVDAWISEIEESCTLSVAQKDSISFWLVRICTANADVTNYNGTSGCPTCPVVVNAGSVNYTGGYYTFDDVIDDFTTGCTAQLTHPDVYNDAICSCAQLMDYIENNLPSSPTSTQISDYLNDNITLDPTNLAITYTSTSTEVEDWLTECALANPSTANLISDNFPAPLLCAEEITLPAYDAQDIIDACIEQNQAAADYAESILNAVLISNAVEEFKTTYRAHCLESLNTRESFTVTYTSNEYQYTLYYYDQASNLVKTVPPRGVVLLDATEVADVADYRNGTSMTPVTPAHKMFTRYLYNSLQQPIEQETFDGGLTYFWYDASGRLVVSQNEKQRNFSPNEGYSYTLYDDLSRPNEAGEMLNATTMTYAISRDETDLQTWLSGGTKREVSQTFYEEPMNPTVDGYFGANGQENLRNRVSSVQYSSNGTDFYTASHYSYDIHGNVKELIQENKLLENFGQSIKRLEYEYDLISGNVNSVSYQRGEYDEFYHKYYYDADNRLHLVETSKDSIIWDTDSKYWYYLHGPIARIEIGEHQVQGIDYAYTIQGWPKGINGNILDPYVEMGRDGYHRDSLPGTPPVNPDYSYLHHHFGRDAFGFTLGYFDNDYTAIGSYGNDFLTDIEDVNSGNSGNSLYNGNIRHIGMAIMDHNQDAIARMAYVYQFDQLNRLKESNAWKTTTNFTAATNNNDYKETFSFDANGNILSLLRNGVTSTQQSMDDMSYNYYANTNKLEYVTDGVTGSPYTDDIESQSAGNFVYNAMGQLIHDDAEEIETIDWHLNGKVKKITRETGSTKVDLEFIYDSNGKRIVKIIKPKDISGNMLSQANWEYTYYVHDAFGNTLAVYEMNFEEEVGMPGSFNGNINLSDQYIYGIKRLGSMSQNIEKSVWFTSDSTTNSYGELVFDDMDNFILPDYEAEHYSTGEGSRIVGQKHYELNNHLGSVIVTVSDKKLPVDTDLDDTIDYYLPDVLSYSDYYSYGSAQPDRKGGTSGRYGFQSQLKDNEIYGDGNAYAFEYRMNDPRLGRFWTIDPMTSEFPYYSPYHFASNNPVVAIDLEGLQSSLRLNYSEKVSVEIHDGTITKDELDKVPAHAWKFEQSIFHGSGNSKPGQKNTVECIGCGGSQYSGKLYVTITSPKQDIPTSRDVTRNADVTADIGSVSLNGKALLVTDYKKYGDKPKELSIERGVSNAVQKKSEIRSDAKITSINVIVNEEFDEDYKTDLKSKLEKEFGKEIPIIVTSGDVKVPEGKESNAGYAPFSVTFDYEYKEKVQEIIPAVEVE